MVDLPLDDILQKGSELGLLRYYRIPLFAGVRGRFSLLSYGKIPFARHEKNFLTNEFYLRLLRQNHNFVNRKQEEFLYQNVLKHFGNSTIHTL